MTSIFNTRIMGGERKGGGDDSALWEFAECCGINSALLSD